MAITYIYIKFIEKVTLQLKKINKNNKYKETDI